MGILSAGQQVFCTQLPLTTPKEDAEPTSEKARADTVAEREVIQRVRTAEAGTAHDSRMPSERALPAARKRRAEGAAVAGPSKGGKRVPAGMAERKWIPSGNDMPTTGEGAESSAAEPVSEEGTPAEPGSGQRRRIPSRLQPWACTACTFQNAGAATHCEVCEADKPPAALLETHDANSLHGKSATPPCMLTSQTTC